MPKTIHVDPEIFKQPGTLKFPMIPLHAYNTPFSAERTTRGGAALIDVLRHMMIVREFETMLGSFKAKGNYQGIAYSYKGPAHLSIGQEASAVGQAFHLTIDDHIFGSHRSHGEILAKGLSSIRSRPISMRRRTMTAVIGLEMLAMRKRMPGCTGKPSC